MLVRLPLGAGRSVLALGLAAALVAAGCGGSSSSSNGIAAKAPAEIVAASKAAADAASTVHVAGSIANGGTALTLDVNLLAGKGGEGQLVDDGLAVELIKIGDTVYIKGSAAFFRRIGGSAAAQLLQGKWLKAPTTSADFASISSLTDLRQLVDASLSSQGPLEKGRPVTVDGQPAVGVTDSAGRGTLYVATSGTAYPVALTRSPPGGGKISFDRWNEPVSLKPPANAIDVSQLQAAR